MLKDLICRVYRFQYNEYRKQSTLGLVLSLGLRLVDKLVLYSPQLVLVEGRIPAGGMAHVRYVCAQPTAQAAMFFFLKCVLLITVGLFLTCTG